jgi:hypothetical protein
MKIECAIHRNRDENSFTARMFEGSIFPFLLQNPGNARTFLHILNKGIVRCAQSITTANAKVSPDTTKIPENLVYRDGMLFVELVDLYSACGKGFDDKTEFDVLMVFESGVKSHLIAIEVKCFQPLNKNELARQREHLETIKVKFNLDYTHIAIVAETYQNRMKFKECYTPQLITWLDLESFRQKKRIQDTDLVNHRTKSQSGSCRNKWSLIHPKPVQSEIGL